MADFIKTERGSLVLSLLGFNWKQIKVSTEVEIPGDFPSWTYRKYIHAGLRKLSSRSSIS
jgi:hypothetical protein